MPGPQSLTCDSSIRCPVPFDITDVFCVNTEHKRANHSNFYSEVEELTFMINIIPN